MKQLKFTGFVNPLMLRSLPLDAKVENSTVTVCGDVLSFEDGPYSDGTIVRVFVGKDFYCRNLEEIEMATRSRARDAQERRRQIKADQEKQAVENLKFNESLQIPVSWCPEIKIVLSGLSERSVGNGCFKKTVVHVFLLENLNTGKPIRKRGEYLCSRRRVRFSPSDYWDKMPPSLASQKVNCKRCLEIAKALVK